MSPAPAPRTSRRATLGGVLAGVAAFAGCDLGSGDPDTAPSPSVDPDDPDAHLVEEVVTDILATRQLVEALRRHHPSLRRTLAAVARVHDAHLAALGSRTKGAGGVRRTGSDREALARVRARELQHQRLLAARATAAQSGRLARLLASMSAAVAQQLVVLPGTEAGR